MNLTLSEFRRAITDRSCRLSTAPNDTPDFSSYVSIPQTGHKIPAAIQTVPGSGYGQIDYLRWLEEIDADICHARQLLDEALRIEKPELVLKEGGGI
jgi:hypothetical protein